MTAPNAVGALTQRARIWYGALQPGQRANLMKFAGVAIFIVILLGAYYATRGETAAKPKQTREKAAVIELGDSRLEDDIRSQVEKERLENRSQNDKQSKDLDDQRAQIDAQSKQLELMSQALLSMQGGKAVGTEKVPPDAAGTEPPADPLAWENAPSKSGARLQTARSPGAEAAPQVIATVFVGDIGSAAPPSAPPGGGSSKAPEQGSKKNGRKVFLPTSFMSARLLTGLKAKTVDAAKEDPEPMLLRIQAPAVLPNDVRAQLQGCFAIAHGYGSLASERVEARLVSLSCIDFEGRSIIEQEITGIVVDKDGVKGLAGRPVTKMGANVARMFVAGLVEGAGMAAQQGAVVTSVSPLGQTQSLDTDKLAQAGAGRGVSKAASELSKIYADLVRQSAPVIEIGPSKDVSILITQGVWLEVTDYAQ